MELSCYFNARFKLPVGPLEFFAEAQYDTLSELIQGCRIVFKAHEAASLDGAQLCFDLSRKGPDSGCYVLDDDSEELFEEITGVLQSSPQHFLNERLGSYDHFNNRITPFDLGIMFPDGTIRVTWDEETSLLDFDTTLQVAQSTLEALVTMQEMPYFQETEDEINGDVKNEMPKRRKDALFAMGLWPTADDEFEPATRENVAAHLATYTELAPHAPAMA